MKGKKEKRFTLIHDRFQACCKDGCGLISGHQRKRDAIEAATRHDCRNVEVWDAMGRKGKTNIVFFRRLIKLHNQKEVSA